jgi:hypothetical protein
MPNFANRHMHLPIATLDTLRKVLNDSPAIQPYAEIIMDRADLRTKKEKINCAVREVFRALPKTHDARALTSICIRRIERDLAKHGLKDSPCDATVRQIVRKIIEESKSNFSK